MVKDCPKRLVSYEVNGGKRRPCSCRILPSTVIGEIFKSIPSEKRVAIKKIHELDTLLDNILIILPELKEFQETCERVACFWILYA